MQLSGNWALAFVAVMLLVLLFVIALIRDVWRIYRRRRPGRHTNRVWADEGPPPGRMF